MREIQNEVFLLDSQQEMWSYLGLFESKKYVEEKIKKEFENISDKELKIRVDNIVYCIRQAREYFISSNQVSMLTSPLLLSYGFLNLSKAIVYYKSPIETDFSNFFRRHGLEVKCDSPFRFINGVNIQFHRSGVYTKLASVYDEPSFAGIELSLVELLSQVPDLYELYYLIYGDYPRVFPLYTIKSGYTTNNMQTRQYEKLSLDLKELNDFYTGKGYMFEFGDSDLGILQTTAAKKSLNELGLLLHSIPGEHFLRTFPRINGKYLALNEMSIHYLIIFTYGMLSRYHSTIWGRIIDNNISSETELIKKSIQVSRHRFLLLTLNMFFDGIFEAKNSIARNEKILYELVEFKEEVQEMFSGLRQAGRSGI